MTRAASAVGDLLVEAAVSGLREAAEAETAACLVAFHGPAFNYQNHVFACSLSFIHIKGFVDHINMGSYRPECRCFGLTTRM